MRHKIGAYIRVSTEEQAQVVEGSLDSQRHRLESFVDLKNVQEANWGKIVEVYADEGFSAKDTKRPALQRLLRDLRAGKLNLILVTDLSRLSRNILDFCLLLEDLRKHNGKFLSVKEQFDTTTAAGEMMVFNMINLAQFERKQTAERVSQNFHSRALRGLLNGGPVLLGYDKHPDNPSLYLVNETEAPIVREIFRLFLEEGSLARTAKRLNDSGIPRKLGVNRKFRLASQGFWTHQAVKNLIENKAYIGIREINKKYRTKDPMNLKPWQQHRESTAAWPAIVSTETFETAQRVLRAGRKQERPKSYHKDGSPFLLTGRLRCAECNAPYIGETGHGKTTSVRYYGHKQYAGISFRCPIRRFSAEVAESAVETHLMTIALNPKDMKEVEIAIADSAGQELADVRKEKERIQLRLLEIERESQNIFRNLGDMSDPAGLAMVKERIAALGAEKSTGTTHLVQIEERLQTASDSKKAIKRIENGVTNFKSGWKRGSVSQKKRLIRAIFERMEVRVGGLGLFYLVRDEDAGDGNKDCLISPSFPQYKESASGQNDNRNHLESTHKKAVGNFVIPTASFDVVVKNGVMLGSQIISVTYIAGGLRKDHLRHPAPLSLNFSEFI